MEPCRMSPPSAPKISTPPPPPTIDQARVDADRADIARGRRGRAATFLADEQGRGTGSVAVKTLLGQGG